MEVQIILFQQSAYREELRHTLWLMPGVKEANAFEELLREHPIFGKEYKIAMLLEDRVPMMESLMT